MRNAAAGVVLSMALAAAASAQTGVAGDWLLTQDVLGNPLHRKLVLKVEGGKIAGTLGTASIEGTVSGDTVKFTRKNNSSIDDFTGMFSGDRLAGTVIHTETSDPRPQTSNWSARRVPQRRAGPAQRHEF